MPTTCVIGALWGDEGKGKVIDVLAAKADLVVRYGGGHNAGHTLQVGERKLVLHLVPSGILHPAVVNVIGNGVAVDPLHLREEVTSLRETGIEVDLGRNLLVSERAPVILELHRAVEKWAESLRGESKIGTTGRGIGPAYADRASRSSLRLGDLIRPARLDAALDPLLAEKNALFAAAGMPEVDRGPLREDLLEAGEALRPAIQDTGALLRTALADGRHVLFEGAQGVHLDLEHGTYPFVTSSSSSTGGIAPGTGLPPLIQDRVIGVVKAYSTRVGEGPFPTELHGEAAETLREAGGEYGSTTGRPRRCGWFDAVAVRYAVAVSGISELTLTNLDVLGGFDVLPVAVAYELGGKRITEFPAFDADAVKPVYEEYEGFQGDISGVRNFADLPRPARDYVEAIEEQVGVPVHTISVGPDRQEVIRR
jgi:adenylosuccinate synthase